MRVWIDLSNSPHPLLFAPIARRLEKLGAVVLVTARDNAQTLELTKQRFPNAAMIGGESPAGRIAKLRSVGERVASLAGWARRTRPDIAVSHNSYAQLVAARALRIPSVTAMDFEHQPANHLAFRVASRILLPEAIAPESVRRQGASVRKLVRYPGLKEELYLADFEPDPGILDAVGVRHSKGSTLVVARTPPSRASYHRFSNSLFTQCLLRLDSQANVHTVILPRHSEQRRELTDLKLSRCVLANAAIDARSLIREADLVIGAGGTMTREAALMGVPTFTVFAGKAPAVDTWLERQGSLRRLSSPEQVADVGPRERAPNGMAALRARGQLIENVFMDELVSLAAGGNVRREH